MYFSTEEFALPGRYRWFPRYQAETILEKGSGALNEDVLLESGDLFGVFDGATSLSDERFAGGLTGGLLAARIAAQAFKQGRYSLYHLAEAANRRLYAAQRRRNVPMGERHRLWSTSLAVIRLGEKRFEYCQTGDALILMIRKDGSHEVVTPMVDIDRETLLLWQLYPGRPNAAIHDLLAGQIHRVRLQMNIRYGVLNGEPEAMDFLCHGFRELEDISDILIFTDGLFPPRENPAQDNDWDALVALYRHGGLTTVRDHVRRLQDRDPALRRYPRFKRHDDIAAVAIRLGGPGVGPGEHVDHRPAAVAG